MAKEALDAVFAAVDLNAAPSSAPLQVMLWAPQVTVHYQSLISVCCLLSSCMQQ